VTNPLLWLGWLLLALAVSSCRTTIGDAQVVIRPGTRVPDRVVETVTGEYEMMEGLDPEGDAVMLMMRAYW
jgi:hypothetical protein